MQITSPGGSATVSGLFPPRPTIWANSGVQIASPINTILCDTGQLPAGNYWFNLVAVVEAAVEIRFEHRNAANAATLDEFLFDFTTAVHGFTQQVVVTLALNERMRAYNVTAFGATIHGQASIFGAII